MGMFYLPHKWVDKDPSSRSSDKITWVTWWGVTWEAAFEVVPPVVVVADAAIVILLLAAITSVGWSWPLLVVPR